MTIASEGTEKGVLRCIWFNSNGGTYELKESDGNFLRLRALTRQN